jgi:hypothetical protein
MGLRENMAEYQTINQTLFVGKKVISDLQDLFCRPEGGINKISLN